MGVTLIFFKINDEGKPSVVAGCPPDAFRKSVSYGVIQFMIWEAMKQDGFTWWVARLRF